MYTDRPNPKQDRLWIYREDNFQGRIEKYRGRTVLNITYEGRDRLGFEQTLREFKQSLEEAEVYYKRPDLTWGSTTDAYSYIVTGIAGAGGGAALLRALTAYLRRNDGKEIIAEVGDRKFTLKGYEMGDAESLMKAINREAGPSESGHDAGSAPETDAGG